MKDPAYNVKMVPAVFVNGKLIENWQSSLLGAICEAYTGPQPPSCTKEAIEAVHWAAPTELEPPCLV